MISASMEDYLKAIYELEDEAGSRVKTSSIADHLGVTSPTVTSGMEKLEDRSLIDRKKYEGVRLTEKGRKVALETVRHHRLLETFLSEYLDYSWTDVHDEADVLEHHISEEFERKVASALDDPEVDPHGDPIPTESLDPVTEETSQTLSDSSEGETVVVERVSDRDEEKLRYLSDAGIVPGTVVRVVEVAPIGMVVVEVEDESEQSLPEEIAERIYVSNADKMGGAESETSQHGTT
ncbi:metal-dependent transcriptional regulator [Halorutilales archaeon Cl-col2-1]